MLYKVLGFILIIDSLLRFRHYFASQAGHLFLIALGEMMVGVCLLTSFFFSPVYHFISISVFFLGFLSYEYSHVKRDGRKVEDLKPFLGIIPVIKPNETARSGFSATGKMLGIISCFISIMAGVVILSSEGSELHSLPFLAALFLFGIFSLFRSRKDA
ncbi:hypothetical protein KAU32_04935 [bacterium]|nr:hypothetical protein [bacterium]